MLCKWLLFFPSLIHFSVGTWTTDDSKTGVNLVPPSPTPGTVFFRNRRDRRMTHWESESHSNFDDGDSNGSRGQISYSSILKEPSSLQTPVNLKIAEKSSSPDFTVTRNPMTAPFSIFNHCVVGVFPLRSIASWLLFAGAKYNSGSVRNGPLGMENSMIPICKHIPMQDQRIEEPMYVEEPAWIVINLNRNNLGNDDEYSEREPFYVARGKRSPGKPTKASSGEEKWKNPQAGKLELSIATDSNDHSQELSRTMRKKRDVIGANLRKYLLGSGASNLVSSETTEKSRQNAYLRPRNKHADIFDILKEPFFISRGKKNSIGLQRSESNDGYSTALLNFDMNRQFLDAWQPGKAKKDCDSSSNCFGSESKIKEPPSEPFRDRRGVVEELLKDNDPFYLSRGKRSPDAPQGDDRTTDQTESPEADKNLSIDAQH